MSDYGASTVITVYMETLVRAHRLSAPAASYKMDVTTVDTLIVLVAERPAIWNKNNHKHSCRLEVEKCWKEIGAALKVDENTLRKKWKYLRDQFCVELGKIQKSANGTSKWRHFKALDFLKSSVHARIYGKEDEEYDSDLDDEDDQSSSDYFERNSLAEIKRKKKTEKPKKKKKHKAKSIPDTDSVSDKFSLEEEDEHLHFFKSILSHVRRIPESKLLSFRGRMQCLVEEFAYGTNPTAEFLPEFPIKGSPHRYSSEACDPIDTSD